MDLINILFICLIFYLGYNFGCTVTYFRVSRIIKKLTESLNIDLEHELSKLQNIQQRNSEIQVDQTYTLETEVHGDIIYLFDKNRNDFICQAKSIEECARLAKEFKKINDAIVKHGDKLFVFNDGKSTEKIK